MTTLDALRAMLAASGVTPYRAALLIGRRAPYVSTMLRRGSCPSADLLARLAAVCGYRLELVPIDGGNALEIGGSADGDGTAGGG